MRGLCARQHELLVWGVEGGICESRRVRYERLPNSVAHRVIFWLRRCGDEESAAPRFHAVDDILAGMLYMPCPLRSLIGCMKWSLFLSLACLLLPLLPSPVAVFSKLISRLHESPSPSAESMDITKILSVCCGPVLLCRYSSTARLGSSSVSLRTSTRPTPDGLRQNNRMHASAIAHSRSSFRRIVLRHLA